MECDTYSIELADGAWVLRLNGRPLERFAARDEAERAAAVAARLSKRRGRTTTILVENRLTSPERLVRGSLRAGVLAGFSPAFMQTFGSLLGLCH